MTDKYVTITGTKYCYGNDVFKVGRLLRLRKEPDNIYDSEAIAVLLPFIGRVGYIANSIQTVYDGTSSGGRIYNDFDEIINAQVMFITHSGVIAKLVFDEKDEYEALPKEAWD